jgi:hypothetical protein
MEINEKSRNLYQPSRLTRALLTGFVPSGWRSASSVSARTRISMITD